MDAFTEHIVRQAEKQLAKERGEAHLLYAKVALKHGDTKNAYHYVEEGLFCCAGPFYLRVRDELNDLKRELLANA